METKTVAAEVKDVVIRFSGDSGDGMQLTGTMFSDTSALFGNDLSTFPDFPSEIRAPQGTVAGVSGFQVHIGETEISTPGDYADVLIAMNPAALKANKKWVKTGGTIILDYDNFTEKTIKKAGYQTLDVVDEDKLQDYNVIKANITSLTLKTLEDTEMSRKDVLRCKNMFALGMVNWLYSRPLDYAENLIRKKFKKKVEVAEANIKVLNTGYNYAETLECWTPYTVKPAKISSGKYRSVNGNVATAWGLMAAAEKSGLKLFCGSYPITPATDILQELAKHKALGVKTFQAEDEIAGICTSIGASFAGSLSATTTSGPGLALKTEAMGLAVMAELPLVVVNVQRGGPSTGLPTKTEQSDLFQALKGRNGECPMVVISASTPGNCFYYAYRAAKIAIEHMTPVLLLTDGFLGNGSQPWKIPDMNDLPGIEPKIITKEDNKTPFDRDENLARYWALPGTEGMEHRIGGLEKDYVTGNVSHDPDNHQKMCEIRKEKVEKIDVPDIHLKGAQEGDLLVVGWGGTYGHLHSAVEELVNDGKKVGHIHFNYLYPLPKNVEEIFSKFKKIVVCELNLGQMADYLRMNYPKYDYMQFNKVQGLPFTVVELKNNFENILNNG